MRVMSYTTNFSEEFHILRRNVRDMITNVCMSSVKYPLLLSDFN